MSRTPKTARNASQVSLSHADLAEIGRITQERYHGDARVASNALGLHLNVIRRAKRVYTQSLAAKANRIIAKL